MVGCSDFEPQVGEICWAPTPTPRSSKRADMTLNFMNENLAAIDPQIAAALDAERNRQETTLEMIASENFAPIAVMQTQGSVATNKYAEGYPGKRYYNRLVGRTASG
jgi:hypothetical protein